MDWKLSFLALTSFAVASAGARARAAGKPPEIFKVCDNLVFSHAVDPDLSGDEKRLACGKGAGPGALEEWQDIPASQREFHLRVFLQSRGYLHPKFEVRPETLFVDPGQRQKVTKLEVRGAPPRFDYTRKRRIEGQTLTPALLDQVKNWTQERLRGLGYGCPVIRLDADSDTGAITSTITSGERGRIASIEEEDVPGLLPGIFRRYDAFEAGGWFNGDLLNLTEKRVTNEGQVESLKLSVDRCEGGLVHVRQEVVAGKPRLLTLGAGVNTEGLLLARAEWKNVRLGRSASYLDIALQAAGNQQTFSALMHWYVLPWVSRWYLKPASASTHRHETPFETLVLREELTANTTYDTDDFGYQFGFGPVYDYVKTVRGAGASTTRFLLFEPSFRVATHYFDFYSSSPRSGFQIGLTGDLSQHEMYSDVGFQEVTLKTEALWNLNNYSPPLVVFGLRGVASSTFVGSGNAFNSPLPPPFRQYLGGSGDLRGFGLLELPADQLGRLTAVYGGFETRLVDLLPIGLQPFLFTDVGGLGAREVDLEKPLFWSPGFGIRDETPIGSFRLTLAHGYVTGNGDPQRSHLQVFFSYGEEF